MIKIHTSSSSMPYKAVLSIASDIHVGSETTREHYMRAVQVEDGTFCDQGD